jgi:hypothetical protein
MRTPDQIKVEDEIDKLLTQANAITGLLRVEPNARWVGADDVVPNAAWLLSDLLQRVKVLILESKHLAEVSV